jgi:DNA polymerase III subunit gamma/tau
VDRFLLIVSKYFIFMAYQVLARKWRPRNFPEMVGQSHVLQALTNALDSNRLHHAYLFTGTRGVGKTTIARILAKSLNCEKGVTAYPCGQCIACREIDEGRFVDLIEVDAASRTKVEDTRDLLDNVQYAPTRGRYKVYLIDEVHMLSTHSFNALLKTLEEPPPHVKFLLATTDPQKLPPTILSRCLQFNLKRITQEHIAQHLTQIVEQEGISYQSQALRLLAQAADGSLRDALSLLDQAIAYGAGQLSSVDVGNMLGTVEKSTVIQLIKMLAAFDGPGLLQHIGRLAEQNPDFFTVLGDILSFLQKIALAQVMPSVVDINETDGEAILQLAQQISAEDIQLFYQIGLLGRRDLPFAPEPRSGFEMVMLRMLAFRPMKDREMQPPKTTTTQANPPITKTTTPTTITTQAVNVTPEASKAEKLSPSLNTHDEWQIAIQSLEISSPLVKQLAINCQFKKRDGNIWYLRLPSHYNFLLAQEKSLEELVQKHYGQTQSIIIECPKQETSVQRQHIQEDSEEYAVKVVENDRFVLYMKKHCDAQINEITPLESSSVDTDESLIISEQ